MAKLKNPFFSFRARGTIGDSLTIRNQKGTSIAEATPHPRDAATAEQLSWRTMYQACSALWHDLSPAEQQTWKTLANARHMSGFALWQSQCLRPNPGIYLPLAGGTMSGAIDMDSNLISNLPTPTLDGHAARKKYVDDSILAGAVPLIIEPNLERWVVPGWYSAYFLSTSLDANRIYYVPIFVNKTTTYTAMGCYVQQLSAGTLELRIYTWTSGLPDALLLAPGTVDTGTTGIKSIVINQQLTRGPYWIACRATGTPKIYSPNITYAVSTPMQGISNYPGCEIKNSVLYADAAMADPAPAPDGMLTANYCFITLREN